MLMPIVSMNKMAMNESVAATCCYHEKASPTNVYWEVLNGGWIGAGYVELTNFRKWGANNGWTNFNRDLDKAADANVPALPKLSKNLSGDWVVRDNSFSGSAIWGEVDTEGNYWVDMESWLRSMNYSMKDACCNHNDSSCVYFVSSIQYAEHQHFNASTKHNVPTSGQSWNLPHDAGQFNS